MCSKWVALHSGNASTHLERPLRGQSKRHATIRPGNGQTSNRETEKIPPLGPPVHQIYIISCQATWRLDLLLSYLKRRLWRSGAIAW